MTAANPIHPVREATFGDRLLMDRYDAVLTELTDLARTEGALLEQSDMPLPMGLIRRKERMSSDYALLTAELKKRALTLRDAGLLDPDDLEPRIRGLVAILKANQRHLNARKVVTAHRVDMVMKALAANTDREDAMVVPIAGPTAIHATSHRA